MACQGGTLHLGGATGQQRTCEIALAHVNSDRVEAAYRRTDLFDRRRELMQQWDDYIAS